MLAIVQALKESQLSCDAITADFRIWQRKGGHRYSLDDVATAWEAAELDCEPERCIDLGCGIGSVLLMVSWAYPQARVLGIEAQEQSFELAQRNRSHNGLEERVELFQGDLREYGAQGLGPKAQLVTGTPPYLPLGTAIASPDPQRAAARIELRGGVEDYLAAAARLVDPRGWVVVCADGRRPGRVLQGADTAGLFPVRRRDVYAREGAKEPLFSVWTLRSRPGPLEHLRLTVRDASGQKTGEARVLRERFGLPG